MQTGARWDWLEGARQALASCDSAAAQDFQNTARHVFGSEPFEQGSGLLNRNGAPVEFAFSTWSGEQRYTFEVSNQNLPPQKRLCRTYELLQAFGSEAQGDPLLMELQKDIALRWGAWLGFRVRNGSSDEGDSHAKAYKIYAEVGANKATKQMTESYLGAICDLQREQLDPVLVGRPAGSDTALEIYCEMQERSPRVDKVCQLLSACLSAVQQQKLLELVSRFAFRVRPEPGRLPPAHYGVSYSLSRVRELERISLFVLAVDLAGTEAQIAQRALRVAEKMDCSLGNYRAFINAGVGATAGSALHNMLSFTAGTTIEPGFQVVLSPPAVLSSYL
jgi:hypothetical protein